MSVEAVKQWQHIGGETVKDFLKSGLLPLEGAEVFNRIIEASLPRLIISTQDLATLIHQDMPSVASFLNASEKIAVSSHERPELSNDYVEPKNDTERKLVAIWQELLGVSQIGIRDNFFELGGQSLTAVRMITQIHEKMGIELALTEIYEYSTIQELAKQVLLRSSQKQKTAAPFSPLVRIQPYGEKQPMFFMHAAEGNVFCYIELSRQLGMDQPFYGLKAYGIEPGTSPILSVEEMVEKYVQVIRSVQPKGPYVLGGHCIGGAIAYDTAQYLRSMNEEVRLLVIIDGFAPPLFRIVAEDDEVMDILTFSQTLSGPFGVNFFPFFCEIREIDPSEGVEGVYRSIQQLSKRDRLATLLMCVKKAKLKLDIDIEYMERAFHVYRGVCNAFRYHPGIKPYDSSAIFFRATDEPNRQTDHLTLGWGDYIPDIKIYDVPGDHFTMLTLPHVRVLAEQLKLCLNQQ